MRNALSALLFVCFLSLASVTGAACGGDDNAATQTDASTQHDATGADGNTPDAAGDASRDSAADAAADSGTDASGDASGDARSDAGDAAPEAGDGGTLHVVHVAPNGSITFSPMNLQIAVGDTVQWTWDSGGHTVTSGASCTSDGKFGTGTTTENAGFTYSFRFTTAGSFPYFCVPHCGAGMTGTITVQ
jgi:plastocyanin